MENLQLAKVKKSCKVIATITNVLKNILIVLAIITIVSGIICFICKANINDYMKTKEDTGFTVNLDEFQTGLFSFDANPMVEKGMIGEVTALYCLLGTIASAIIVVILIFLNRVFKNILNSDTPFDKGVISNMKVSFIVTTIGTALMFGIFEGLMVGLIFWCIYRVFEYGYVLQKQADETI